MYRFVNDRGRRKIDAEDTEETQTSRSVGFGDSHLAYRRLRK
jgi:hypothetical protein